jgi:hypothetical protein
MTDNLRVLLEEWTQISQYSLIAVYDRGTGKQMGRGGTKSRGKTGAEGIYARVAAASSTLADGKTGGRRRAQREGWPSNPEGSPRTTGAKKMRSAISAGVPPSRLTSDLFRPVKFFEA